MKNNRFPFCLLMLAMLAGLMMSPDVTFLFSNVKVIKNPEPNLVEKNFCLLKKIHEIKDEVGKNEYLFMPYSLTMDKKNNLFIYDKGQAKILVFDASFKFIKSFGMVGNGPGEFSGSGKAFGIPILIGEDGHLYAHDHMANKVLVFNTDGKFTRQIKISPSYAFNFIEPTVDKLGNLIFQEFRDDRLVIFNEKGDTLFSIMNKAREKEYLFSELKMFPKSGKNSIALKYEPFSYDGGELRMKITSNSKLLLYFATSATLYVVDLRDKKNTKSFRVWPEEAIKLRKEEFATLQSGYAFLFSRLIPDGDQRDLFYLDFGKNKDRQSICIYGVNIEGQLMGVLCIPITKKAESPSILLKQNNFFFAKDDDKVSIYREEK